MLHNSTLTASAALATQLSAAGRTLAAAPGSVLSTLVQASCIPVNLQIENLETDMPGLISSMSMSTDSTADQTSEHDRAIADLADDVAGAVTQHLSVAQNVVSPMVVQLGERLVNLLDNVKPVNPANAFTICEVDLPAPMYNEAMSSEIGPYKGLSVKGTVNGMGFGAIGSAADIRQKLIDSGFENAKDISKWAATVGDDVLLAAWQSFFEAAGPRFTSFNSGLQTLHTFDLGNLWFAIFLLTHHFKDNVQENGMALADYTASLTSIRDVAGVELVKLFGQAEAMQTNGTVVLADEHLKHTVLVFAPTYNKWLKDGGSVEALLGMSVGDRSLRTIKDLKDNAEALTRSWNAWIAFKNTEARAKFPDVARSLVSSAFLESLNEVADVEKEFYGENMTRRDAVVAQSGQYIQGLTASDLDKPFEIAFRLVAEIRFHFTSAAAILSDINATLTMNPKTDPQEAATIATLHYLADYLADQIGVS